MSGPTFCVHLFGHPKFEYDGLSYRVTAGRRAVAILCYLALKARAPIARESVAFALWPDLDEEDARTALRRELHRAVKALPPAAPDTPWILADELTLQWNPATSSWIDVHEFELLVDRDDDLERATALYRGDLLENIQDDWVFNDRERLRAAQMFALGEVLARYRSARNYSAAIACAQQILAADPFREDTVRALLALRYESGDRAGALREADRYARLYKDELGVGFMPETEALRDTIAAAQSLLPNATSAEPARERVSVATPFMGRSQELERCRSLWSRAARGFGSVLFIGGEAGIGKSRLLDELALVAEREGGRIIRGYTSPPESVPYQAFSTALQSAGALIAAVPADDSSVAAICRIAPQVAHHAKRPLAPLAELDPAREQQRLFAALTHYLGTLAETRPLLLILEDLHWAGVSTLDALRALAQNVRSYPLLVALTYRTEETFEPLSALRRDLVGAGIAHHLALRRLCDSDVQTIVRGAQGFANADDALVRELTTVAEGHPFFLVEALAQCASSDTATVEISGGVRGVIDARLQRLQPIAMKTAEIASNIGDRFAFDVLHSVSGLDEGVLLQAIAELTDAHVVQETSGRSAFDYCFTHHLIQEAAYARIPTEQRRRRHYRIAQALAGERFGSDRSFAGEIARHYDRANSHTDAAAWYARAARYASESYANVEALSYLERALQLVESAADRFEFLKLRESLRRRLGQPAGRREDLEAMAALAGELGDAQVFDVLTRRADLAISDGSLDEGREITLEMERQAPGNDRLSDALINFANARILWIEGRLDASLERAESALQSFAQAGDRHGELDVHCLIANVSIKHGDFERARKHIDLANQCALGDREQLALTLFAASRESFAQARYEEALLLARESRDAFATMGDRTGIADVTLSMVNSLGRLERFREATACAAEAGEIYRSLGNRNRVAAVTVSVGTLHAWRGNLPEARRCFNAAEKVFREMKDVRAQTITTGNLGWIELMLGNNERAHKESARAVQAARHMKMPTLEGEFMANLGAAERELGDIKASIEHLERCVELRSGAVARNALFNDLCELALSYAQGGDCARAVDLAKEALAYTRAGERTVWLHYHLWTAARAFALCGLYELAEETRLEAEEQMLRRRAELEDDPIAMAEFEKLPFHRDIETSFTARAK